MNIREKGLKVAKQVGFRSKKLFDLIEASCWESIIKQAMKLSPQKTKKGLTILAEDDGENITYYALDKASGIFEFIYSEATTTYNGNTYSGYILTRTAGTTHSSMWDNFTFYGKRKWIQLITFSQFIPASKHMLITASIYITPNINIYRK